jgi:cell division septation protein DedD
MKSKIILFGLIIGFLFSLESCKTKESAYKAAYEAAKEREVQSNTPAEVTPVEKATSDAATSVQKEKVTAIDGVIQQFSVVVGSFTNKTNAVNLKERMDKDGYKSVLAQNEKGMFRVIVATFSDKNSAARERDQIKTKYYNANPNFQDAWILEKQ